MTYSTRDLYNLSMTALSDLQSLLGRIFNKLIEKIHLENFLMAVDFLKGEHGIDN